MSRRTRNEADLVGLKQRYHDSIDVYEILQWKIDNPLSRHTYATWTSRNTSIPLAWLLYLIHVLKVTTKSNKRKVITLPYVAVAAYRLIALFEIINSPRFDGSGSVVESRAKKWQGLTWCCGAPCSRLDFLPFTLWSREWLLPTIGFASFFYFCFALWRNVFRGLHMIVPGTVLRTVCIWYIELFYAGIYLGPNHKRILQVTTIQLVALAPCLKRMQTRIQKYRLVPGTRVASSCIIRRLQEVSTLATTTVSPMSSSVSTLVQPVKNGFESLK